MAGRPDPLRGREWAGDAETWSDEDRDIEHAKNDQSETGQAKRGRLEDQRGVRQPDALGGVRPVNQYAE